MTYILKSTNEGPRLDQQTEIEQFSLASELRGINLDRGTKVLDAGCGSGVLCRYLESNYQGLEVSGCDLSAESLRYAKERSGKPDTKYFEHDLVKECLSAKFDVIFNRLVAHHLGENLSFLYRNLYISLKESGRLYIIDTDGLFLNLSTLSPSLQQKMQAVHTAFKGNLYAGRVTPPLLKHIGFNRVTWRIETMDFHGENRKKEVQQWKERFESSISFYVGVFGSEFEARKFFKEYTAEASKDHVPMFYNKFIIEGCK